MRAPIPSPDPAARPARLAPRAAHRPPSRLAGAERAPRASARATRGPGEGRRREGRGRAWRGGQRPPPAPAGPDLPFKGPLGRRHRSARRCRGLGGGGRCSPEARRPRPGAGTDRRLLPRSHRPQPGKRGQVEKGASKHRRSGAASGARPGTGAGAGARPEPPSFPGLTSGPALDARPPPGLAGRLRDVFTSSPPAPSPVPTRRSVFQFADSYFYNHHLTYRALSTWHSARHLLQALPPCVSPAACEVGPGVFPFHRRGSKRPGPRSDPAPQALT